LFLSQQRVRTCDVVVGELLLGSGLPKSFANDLARPSLICPPSATDTRAFINLHGSTFAGAGVGWADVQILVAAAAAGARIHTSDRYVRRVCAALGVALA